MSYEVELEKCTISLGGLLLEDGTYLRKTSVKTYFRNFYLGDFQVEKIIKNLNSFLSKAQKMMEERKQARIEDLRLAASLGTIINYYPTLKDELKNLAKSYFG
ncbi:MAG: hypothetical protein QXS48_03635 [Candidatus Aenigmatarchaeota archaeon]